MAVDYGCLFNFTYELEIELQTFFTFSRSEQEVIDAHYGARHKLGLALQVLSQ
jgi:hypothetical protein